MEITKTTFQKKISEIEHLLENYKNSYPKNYGEIFERWIPFVILIVAPIILINLIYSPYLKLIKSLIVEEFLFRLFPFILIYPLLKYFKKVTKVDYTELEQKIRVTKEEFSEYPDVVNYLNKTEEELEDEIERKNTITPTVNLIMIGIILIAILITVGRLSFLFRY